MSCKENRYEVNRKGSVKLIELSATPLFRIQNIKNYYSEKSSAIFVAEESYFAGRNDIYDSAHILISKYEFDSTGIERKLIWQHNFDGYRIDFDNDYFKITNEGCCDQKDLIKYYSYRNGGYIASATFPKYRWFDNTDVFIADVFGKGLKLDDNALFRYYVISNEHVIDSADYKYSPDGKTCSYGRVVENVKIRDSVGRTTALKVRVYCQDNIERSFEFKKPLS